MCLADIEPAPPEALAPDRGQSGCARQANDDGTNAAGEKLDRALRQSQRLDYAVTSLDSHARTKLPLRIAAYMEKRLGHPLSEPQKVEVRSLFERFMAGLLEESARKLRPFEKFCQAVGSVTS